MYATKTQTFGISTNTQTQNTKLKTLFWEVYTHFFLLMFVFWVKAHFKSVFGKIKNKKFGSLQNEKPLFSSRWWLNDDNLFVNHARSLLFKSRLNTCIRDLIRDWVCGHLKLKFNTREFGVFLPGTNFVTKTTKTL